MAKVQVKSNKIRDSKTDVVLDVITSILLGIIILIVAYPVIFVISCSFSTAPTINSINLFSGNGLEK